MKQNKITLKIEDLNLTAEDVVKYYYRAFGCYTVLNSIDISSNPILKKTIIEKFPELEEKFDLSAGLPDLFIYSNKKYFFVEVKTDSGFSFNPNQLNWYSNNSDIMKKVKIILIRLRGNNSK